MILHRKLRRVAIVTLKTGEAFRGVLYSYDRRAFEFRNCQLLSPVEQGPVPVDGALVVLAGDVAYMNYP